MSIDTAVQACVRLGRSSAVGLVDLLTWTPSIRLIDVVLMPCSSVNTGLVGVEVVIVMALLPWLVASSWSWASIPGLINMLVVGCHGVGTVAGDAHYCTLLANHGHWWGTMRPIKIASMGITRSAAKQVNRLFYMLT